MKAINSAIVLALMAMPAMAAEGEGGNIFAGDLGNMIWTVVIFALVVVVLGKFAWGPILEGLQARETFIRDSLVEAKAGREAADETLKSYQAKLPFEGLYLLGCNQKDPQPGTGNILKTG